jgi:hypothetical protein
MGKLFLLILLGGGLWLGWELHTKGRDEAVGGAFATKQLPAGKEALGARPTRLSPAAQEAPVPGVD